MFERKIHRLGANRVHYTHKLAQKWVSLAKSKQSSLEMLVEFLEHSSMGKRLLVKARAKSEKQGMGLQEVGRLLHAFF